MRYRAGRTGEQIIENTITIPNGSEFKNDIQTAIDRRTEFSIAGDDVIAKRNYCIGKMNYTVNSIFNKRIEIDNNIKYLIANQLNRKNN